MQQHTINRKFTVNGVGLHSGQRVEMSIAPAPIHCGIVFVRTDLPQQPRIGVSYENLYQRMRRTSLVENGAEVYTTEHLLAACYALNIHNLLIEIDGDEVPGLDGSAAEFYQKLHDAGVEAQSAEIEEIVINNSIEVFKDKASIRVSPYADGLKLEYHLEHEMHGFPAQHFAIELNAANFGIEVAPARTFALKREVDYLLKLGLGKGASIHNTLVIDDDGRIIDNALRFPDECARHKILDLVGDLALVKRPVRGYICAMRSGHALNAELVKKLAHMP